MPPKIIHLSCDVLLSMSRMTVLLSPQHVGYIEDLLFEYPTEKKQS